jgi:hypothetical protein
MALIAEELTAGLNPQNSVLSRKRFTRRGLKQPKAVSKKVKFDIRISAFALFVFAVDYFGFRWMHLQAALRQASL